MDGQCIFQAQFKGRRFRIIEQDNPKREGSKIYWAYEGRKKLDPLPWLSLAGAVGSVLCEQDVRLIADLRRVWG